MDTSEITSIVKLQARYMPAAGSVMIKKLLRPPLSARVDPCTYAFPLVIGP